MTNQCMSPAERAIIRTVALLLPLDAEHERLRAGGQPGSVVLETDPPATRPVMLLHPPTWGGLTFRGRETVERWVEEAMALLAEARAWREIGGPTRPAALVKADRLTRAVTEGLGIDPADLLQRIDAGVPGEDKGWPGSWRLEAPVPALLRHGGRNSIGRLVERRPGEAWMRGRLLDGLAIEAVGLSDRVAVVAGRREDMEQRYEIRTSDMFPDSVAMAAIGRDAAAIVDHPAIRLMAGTVVSHATTRTSTRFGVSTVWEAPKPLSADGKDVLARHLAAVRSHQALVVAAVCDGLGVTR